MGVITLPSKLINQWDQSMMVILFFGIQFVVSKLNHYCAKESNSQVKQYLITH